MGTIEKFKMYLTSLGLALAREGMLKEREEWIESLSEEKVFVLLDWMESASKDELIKKTDEVSRVRILQEAIIISATVGKRLNSVKVLSRIEDLYKVKGLRCVLLEGIEIYGSSSSVPFLSGIIHSENDIEILTDAAGALSSIGGMEALTLLSDIKNKMIGASENDRIYLDSLIEELKQDIQ